MTEKQEKQKAQKLDSVLGEILKEHGFGPDSCWQCVRKGKSGENAVWVVYHKTLEKIAANLGISFDSPQVLEHDAERGVAILVTGTLPGNAKLKPRTEWSIGEARPKNCYIPYYYAMAEKRGKDRVILKLLEVHGDVYSEEEAMSEEFTRVSKSRWTGPLNRAEFRKACGSFAMRIGAAETTNELDRVVKDHGALIEQMCSDDPDLWEGEPDPETGALSFCDKIKKKQDQLRMYGHDQSEAHMAAIARE